MLTSWVCARHPLGAPQFTYARAGSTRRSTKQGSIALRGTRRLRILQAGAPLLASTPPLQPSSPPPRRRHEPGSAELGLHPLIRVGVTPPPPQFHPKFHDGKIVRSGGKVVSCGGKFVSYGQQVHTLPFRFRRSVGHVPGRAAVSVVGVVEIRPSVFNYEVAKAGVVVRSFRSSALCIRASCGVRWAGPTHMPLCVG